LYFDEVITVFERDKEKAISMEMFIVDSEYIEDDETTLITSFCFAGVTLLGNIYSPAIPDANAVVTKYSKYDFKELVENTKLFMANNKADMQDNSITTEKEENKLKKFDKKNYLKEFSMTAIEMMDKMESALSGYKCKDGYCKYAVRDFCNKYVYARDWEEDTVVAIPYSFSNKTPMMDLASAKYAYMKYVVDEDSEEKEEDIVQMYADQEIAKVKEKLEKEYADKIKEYTDKIETLETDNKDNAEKITNYTTEKVESEKIIKEYSVKVEDLEKENKELKEFKDNVLEQEKQNKIKFAINSVKDALTEEQIKE
jgi:hypothetical protein